GRPGRGVRPGGVFRRLPPFLGEGRASSQGCVPGQGTFPERFLLESAREALMITPFGVDSREPLPVPRPPPSAGAAMKPPFEEPAVEQIVFVHLSDVHFGELMEHPKKDYHPLTHLRAG